MNSQVELEKAPYSDLITIRELLELQGEEYTKYNRTSYYNPASRYRKAYLGNGVFSKKKFLAIKDYYEARLWFKEQIYLFVEYLNKIEDIRYMTIARRIGYSYSSHIHRLDFSYNVAVKILVGFRQYARKFDTYYEKGE